MYKFASIFLAAAIIASCYGGELTVLYSPSTVRFMKASSLWSSSLDDVLAVSMGYTPKTVPWHGVSVTHPFAAPTAAILVSIDGSGAHLQQEGHRYTLTEDMDISKVFLSLNRTVSANSRKETHFINMEVLDARDTEDQSGIASSSLSSNKEPDASFLLEVGTLPTILTKLASETAVNHDGQDFFFLQLESFSLLVKTYGDDSNQVREGKRLLIQAMDALVKNARKIYNDDVIVASVVTDKSAKVVSRKTRAARETQYVDVNLAKEYDVDYPAFFNIILFLSIVMAMAIVAVSLAMAYMDPGRDSIIYRMTNPRMKKDQ